MVSPFLWAKAVDFAAVRSMLTAVAAATACLLNGPPSQRCPSSLTGMQLG
jgi:hypothetical protein